MEKKEEELIRSLIAADAELREHYQKHLELERQLGFFQRKRHLSTEEELEKKRLQKRKLAGKDKIMEILARHRSNQRRGG